MSRMRDRLAAGPAPMGDYHPYGTGATPMTMPLALVRVHQEGMSYQAMQPIWTADGAAVPATAPGSWGQLYAAGARP
jgi:hypothetical protein